MVTHREEWLSILELTGGATRAEIDEAYRHLVQVWHPDRFGHNRRLQLKAQEKLKQINLAYEGLVKDTASPSAREPHAQSASEAKSYSLVRCPHCFRTGRVAYLKVDPSQKIRCPHCAEIFTTGSPATANETASDPPQPSPHSLGPVLSPIVSGVMSVGFFAMLAALLWLSGQNQDIATVKQIPGSRLDLRSVSSSEPAGPKQSSSTGQFTLNDIDESRCDIHDVDRPLSSTELGAKYRNGLGRIKVSNGTERDAVAVLNDERADQPRRAIYIRAREDGQITSIPVGVYRLKFQFGDSWLKSAAHFCEPTGSSVFSEKFTFDEKTVESGTHYDTFTVTLHAVLAGNASSERLPDTPLPLPRN